jgi:AcrR family transcriptional regulator
VETFEDSMRQQRPRGSTTRDAIVSAALDVVDSVGVEALTIRAVAKAVGAPPMSLYTHFANKEELLDLMYAEVSRRLYPDSGQPTWQGELLELGRHVRATLLEHPLWTPLLSRYSVPLVVAVRERALQLMIADGIPPAEALKSLSSVFLVVLGLCLTELHFRGPDGVSSLSRRFDRLREEFKAGDESQEMPATRVAFNKLGRLDLNDAFDLALSRLIAGIASAGGGLEKTQH